jgi:hypothetical protein
VTTAVAGDPASCSRAGGILRRLASEVRTTGRSAHRAFDPGVDGAAGERARPGVAETAARRRYDTVDRAAAALATELDRLGKDLQAHASDLAEALGAARQVAGRAEAAGLRIADGRVVADWGVSGVADSATATTRDSARTALQSELDTVQHRLRRQRRRLAATAAEAQATLAAHAGALRR